MPFAVSRSHVSKPTTCLLHRVAGTDLPHRHTPRHHTGTLHLLLAAVVSLVLSLVTSGAVHAGDADSAVGPEGIPITVEADSLIIRLDQEKAVWKGNVRATQGNYTFRSSQLTVFFDQIETSTGARPRNETSGEEDLTHGYQLSADHLTYDLGGRRITARGNSELRRGFEAILADRIVYQVAERRAYALPSKNGRVQVRFFGKPGQGLFAGGAVAAAGG